MAAHVAVAKLVQRFVDELVAAGAVLFGGAVRDLILAQAHEAAYYAAGGTAADFFDAAVLPAYGSRALVPEDVDAFICEDDFEELDRVWTRLHLLPTRRLSAGSEYLAASNATTHFRYTFGIARPDLFSGDAMLATVHPDLRPLLGGAVTRFASEMRAATAGCRREFSMDLLVVKRAEMENPFTSRPDFDVNGLFMDARGVWLSPAMVADGASPMVRHARMQEVLAGVHARRATYLGWDGASNLRLVKMLKKGWTVPLAMVREVRDAAYDGHCILCHDAVPEAHVKLECCDARYHVACMVDAARAMCKKGKCVMCSQHVARRKLFVDATILRSADATFDVAPSDDDDDSAFDDMPGLVEEENENTLLLSLPSLAHLALPPPMSW